MSTRIKRLEAPYSEQVQNSFNVVMPQGMEPLNIFRTVGVNARVLSRMVNGGLLDRGSISIAQRELVILRSCANCKAEYEWGVHVAGFAVKAGFSDLQVSDTCSRDNDASLWSEEQLLLLAMSDQLHRSHSLDQVLWDQLKAFFTQEQLVELIMVAGLYHAVSFVVNGLAVEPEAFAPAFPVE